MLVQIEGHQREKYGQYFDQMFQQRKVVFHDLKKWSVKVTDNRYEIDEYDRDDTCYLLSLNKRGDLVGSVRLLSTATPHMMAGPFRDMFPEVSFCSPLIWEITRFAVLNDVAVQPNRVSTAACELILGLIRFGLNNGISHLTAISEAPLEHIYRRCGLHGYEELHRRRFPDHGTLIAGLVAVTKPLEHSILAATGLGERPAAPPQRRAA